MSVTQPISLRPLVLSIITPYLSITSLAQLQLLFILRLFKILIMPKRLPRDPTSSDDEPADDIPLHHKQAFGAGLKRKRVEFVKAQAEDDTTTKTSLQPQNASAIGDLYASIVMGSSTEGSKSGTPIPAAKDEGGDICDVCGNIIGESPALHEATLAHQVSLQHSHPPSHLDRSRMGLKALKSQGWDPDARTGLGREGEGRRFPIKVTQKEDTLGIGAKVPEVREKVVKEKLLDAKEMRKLGERERRRGEKLGKEVFGRVDVEGYLRGDTGGGDGLG